MDKPTESKLPQPFEPGDWATLMDSIVARDEQALARLYDLTVERAYSLAYAITRNSSDAEDVVADLYLQVWQRAAQYSEQRGTVLAWVMVNCRSLALDLLRRRRTQERGQQRLAAEPDERCDSIAEDLLNAVQEGTQVHAALGALSDIQRRLIALAYFSDMSHQEIATTTELPLGTVKSHIRRGLKTLRRVLQQQAPHHG